MSEETTVVKRESTSIADMKTVSQLFAESGYFPDAKSMAQAFVKIRAGEEMGIPAMAAMTGIAIIQGKPVAGANIIAAKVKMSGYDYRVRRLDNSGCSIEFFNQKGDSLGTSTFDEKDLLKITTTDKYGNVKKLASKDNWINYPRNMYFARAISNGQKWYCPDATLGMVIYTPDELGGKVDEDGSPVIDKYGKAVIDTDAPIERPEKEESFADIISTKNATDVNAETGEVVESQPPNIPEPPDSAYDDTPIGSQTLTPEELVRESTEDQIFNYVDSIVEKTGETRDACMRRMSEFVGKDGKPQYTTTLRKRDGDPISETWLKKIKHNARLEYEKHYPPNSELPF